MASTKTPPAATPPAKVRVRVIAALYGTEREPLGRKGDVIEIDAAEYEKAGEGVFVLADVAAAQEREQESKVEESTREHMRQREAMHAERKASDAARARVAREQAEYALRLAKDAEEKAARP